MITMAAGEEEASSWVNDMEQKATAYAQSPEQFRKKPSIYRVADFVKEFDKKAYMPKVVSFGPYYHLFDQGQGQGRLLVTEEHKQRALFRLLWRSGKPLAEYVRAMRAAVHELQGSYDTLGEEWADQDRFLKLMIVDGSFMLEVLRRNLEGNVVVEDYSPNDPLFGPEGIVRVFPLIRRDMLLLENQLPLLVLQKLLAVEGCQQSSEHVDYLNRMVLRFVERRDYGPAIPRAGLHVLDLFRQRVVLPAGQRSRPTAGTVSWDGSKHFSASAVELAEAGVVFRCNASTTLEDIRLGLRSGVLPLPPLFIDYDTEVTILNLVAFEWRHVGVRNEVTGFLLFVDDIIKTPEDVRLLRRSGSIRSSLSDEAIVCLFSRLSRGIVNFNPRDNAFGEVRILLSHYCQKRWPSWRANIRQNYFRSPTSIINFVAITVTILLTFLQTLYAIRDFHRSGKPPPPPPSFTSPPASSSSLHHHHL